MHDLFKCFPELGIEDCVDDRIDEAVHVAEPRGKVEYRDAWPAVLVKLRAHRVHNVAGKERYPAEQEHSWFVANEKNVRPFVSLIFSCYL